MYSDKSYEQIKTSMLENVDGIDKREGSFISDMLAPIALELETAYVQFKKMLGIMFLEDTTGEYLEKRAAEYGLTRKNGTHATGTVVFSGQDGTLVPKGTFIATHTQLIFETLEDITLANGIGCVDIIAQNTGDAYNVAAHTLTELPITINNINSVTNEKPTLGGSAAEDDENLLKRLLLQIQNPSTSGNAMHYKAWALEVDGVGDAKVFPLYNGAGTVMLLAITPEGRSIDTTIQNAILDHVEMHKPIGASVSVLKPEEVMINITAQVALNGTHTLQDVVKSYTEKVTDYIKDSVFKRNSVDYFKCLSLFYEVDGVKQVIHCNINGSTANVAISEVQIQTIGQINITEGEV